MNFCGAQPLHKDATVVLRQQQGRHAQRVFTHNGKPILKAGGTAWRKALDRAGIRKYEENDSRTKNSLYPHHADDDYRFSDFPLARPETHLGLVARSGWNTDPCASGTRGLERYQDGTEVCPAGS
jgi:hypothetical protein